MRLRTLAAVLLLLAASLQAEDISVTVYSGNLGVVSETRTLDFKQGVNRIAFADVPSLIDANSVRFTVKGGGTIDILEQNYAYDLVSSAQLLQRYIDKEIEIVDTEGKIYTGTLIAYDSDYENSTITLAEPSGRVRIVRSEHVADFSFPKLPDGLITRPTLFWLYSANSGGSKECQVSYQTGGLNWSAEYVGVLDKTEKQLGLSGWSAISNNSGKTYKDANLKLVAGTINRANQPQTWARGGRAGEVMDMAVAKAGFEEKDFFEYHLYTLPRKATIADREDKQISLFDPASTSVNKIYLYQPDVNQNGVQVAIKFTNSEKAGLGMPLPAGRIRLFKADDDGSLILLGEDQIRHTPRDEELKVQVGTAFDIVAEERITDQKQVSSRVEDRSFEIELRNQKKEKVTVTVEKQLWGFWEMQSESLPHKKLDANRIQFEVPVNASDTTKLTYTVRFSSR